MQRYHVFSALFLFRVVTVYHLITHSGEKAMNKYTSSIAILLSIFFARIGFAQGLKFQVELDNPAKFYSYVHAQSVFISEGEKSMLVDLKSGKNIYELKVEDYQEKGLLKIIDNKFLVSSTKTINCYDVSTGQLLWAKEYHDIEQEYFTEVVKIGNTLLLRYGGVLLAVDIASGNELWYQIIKLNHKANPNFIMLKEQNKILAFLEDDKVGLYDFKTGAQLYEGKEYEVSSTLKEKSYPWMFVTKDERYGVFLLDANAAVINFTENKETARTEISYDTDIPPVLTTAKGCLVLGKKKIVFMNEQNGRLVEVPVAVGDFRTYEIMIAGNKEILLAGLKNSMLAIDLIEGKVLWQTKKDDPDYEGFAHQYIKAQSNNLIFTYNNTGWSIGTDLFLMSVDALTGKLNYKVPVANCKQAIMGFQRMMAGAVSKSDGTKNDFGYDNIGFNYSWFEQNNNIVIAIVSPYGMRVPDKRTDGGEGICIVDPVTGKIVFSDYLELSETTSAQRKPGDYWVRPPFISGNNIILAGDRSIAVWDLNTMKRSWFDQNMLKSSPMDAVVLEDVLYIKSGVRAMNVKLSEDAGGLFGGVGMNVEEGWSEEPFGFSAFNMSDGKLLWSANTNEDPGFLSEKFSLKNDYDAAAKRLLFADEENLYALQLRKDGGKYDWIYKFGENGLGNISLKKCYAIKEFPIGEVNVGYSTMGTSLYRSETSEIGGTEYGNFQEEIADAYDYITYKSGYTIWGAAAKKCLGFFSKNKNILIAANKGIALIDGSTGKTLWKKDWSYDQDNVQLLPIELESNLVYCIDGQLTVIAIGSGAVRIEVKESKRPHFIVSPNKKYIISIDEEGKMIKGYEL
jgi:outer membrane protein assembly factor BamB